MSDIYTNPKEASYLLNKIFTMPDDKGGTLAIALSNHSASYINAFFSIVFFFIFAFFWNLICFATLLSSKKRTKTRWMGLIALWNSSDPWFGAKQMFNYAFGTLAGNKSFNKDFFFGLGYAVLALFIFIGSLISGIFGPSSLQIGTVAPTRPSEVYYPTPPSTNLDNLRIFGIKAPAALRAIGSVEAAKVTLRSKVNLPTEERSADGRNLRISYDYFLTGVDLGLQHSSHLKLTVRGQCNTEYGWLVSSENQTDTYQLWNNENTTITVGYSNNHIISAPKASFQLIPPEYRTPGNFSFAVVVSSAHRGSLTEGTDPWYQTERRPDDAPNPRYNESFWVLSGRPVLSCWEQALWSHKERKIGAVENLRIAEDIGLPEVLREVLYDRFREPVVAILANAAGESALRSRTTSPNGVIDASVSSVYSDMERLLLASYAASRNTFLDTIFFESSETIKNLFTSGTREPKVGAGDIVVSSLDIQTFSVLGMAVIISVLAFLVIIDSILSLCVSRFSNKSSGMLSGLFQCKLLLATNIFGHLLKSRYGLKDSLSRSIPNKLSMKKSYKTLEASQDQRPQNPPQSGNSSRGEENNSSNLSTACDNICDLVGYSSS